MFSFYHAPSISTLPLFPLHLLFPHQYMRGFALRNYLSLGFKVRSYRNGPKCPKTHLLSSFSRILFPLLLLNVFFIVASSYFVFFLPFYLFSLLIPSFSSFSVPLFSLKLPLFPFLFFLLLFFYYYLRVYLLFILSLSLFSRSCSFSLSFYSCFSHTAFFPSLVVRSSLSLPSSVILLLFSLSLPFPYPFPF